MFMSERVGTWLRRRRASQASKYSILFHFFVVVGLVGTGAEKTFDIVLLEHEFYNKP